MGKVLTPKKSVICGVLMIVSSILFLFIIHPIVFPMALKWQFTLRPGNLIRGMWQAFPFSVDFKIYIFNVTNPDEVLEGKKPKLQEVGPFFYDEYKEKANLVDRKRDDTVEYNFKNTYFWNPIKSNGLTGDEEMVVPHVLILGMILTIMRENPSALDMAITAIDSLFHEPKSIFVKLKAKDIFFDGLAVDCTGTDLASQLACDLMKSEGSLLMPDKDEDHYRFSLLGAKNGTPEQDRVRVFRGIKNYLDLGRVVSINGRTKLDVWPGDYCNSLNGTDGTIFPPLFGPEDNLVTFGNAICRSASAYFSHPTRVKGINTLHYVADLIDTDKNPNETCFCSDPDNCLGKNLYEFFNCIGVPIIGTLPHFYNSDEKYLQMVEGLNPIKEKHEIGIDIDPVSAVPLVAHTRMQFNMYTFPIPDFALMANFTEALFPLFWVEEGIILSNDWVKPVKLLHMIIAFTRYFKWIMIMGGFGMFGYAVILYYKNGRRFDPEDSARNARSLNVSSRNSAISEDSILKEFENTRTMKISTIQAAPIPPKIEVS